MHDVRGLESRRRLQYNLSSSLCTYLVSMYAANLLLWWGFLLFLLMSMNTATRKPVNTHKNSCFSSNESKEGDSPYGRALAYSRHVSSGGYVGASTIA